MTDYFDTELKLEKNIDVIQKSQLFDFNNLQKFVLPDFFNCPEFKTNVKISGNSLQPILH